ncbi:unnamed protein product [Haemonchus placei]|uniref:Uncharacterized protein n=1 Tax=Haemonchus placei TaxID=6290 RepID=A0A0N4VSS6_HAEPC|nr:unnamed protein product [Haemonchus placei]
MPDLTSSRNDPPKAPTYGCPLWLLELAPPWPDHSELVKYSALPGTF